MAQTDEAVETILLVDDEESVRQTFREWLDGAGLGCRILAAADAEAALVLANQQTIDLAILDWNLGAGNDGLRLLEDLYVFNPAIVAIMVTGYAHQATPLHAMRMGIRDYLDKNQDLDRDTFLGAVRRQLERIRPAKRERRFHQSLLAFREAVAKVLPLVQTAAALNDPVPLPEAVRSLLRFLLQTTGARDGVLFVHSHDANRELVEISHVYNRHGERLDVNLVPFARSLASSVVSLQEPAMINDLETANAASMELQPFERGRRTLLAAPMAVAPGIQVVMELFDKPAFTAEDQRFVAAAADFGAEMLRQALAERQTHQVLFDAVEAALKAGDSMAKALSGQAALEPEKPLPAAVMDQLREGLQANRAALVQSEETLRLAEAVRGLAVRHGPAAVQHCIRLIESVRALLDSVTSTGEIRS